MSEVVYPSQWDEEEPDIDADLSEIVLGPDPDLAIMLITINLGILYVVTVYFIRKWSKKWNDQLVFFDE